MNEFPVAERYLFSGSQSLDTLSNFFKFYKSLNEDLSTKLSKYISEQTISDQCKSSSSATSYLFSFMQGKASSHLDLCK